MGLLDDFKSLPDAKVLEAVAAGGRYTAADVSARAGCSLEAAKAALTCATSLLGDAATLEVSNGGELVFNLPPQPNQQLKARSQAAALRAQVDAAKPQLFTALRVAFGVGLLVSIAAVYSAIFFISASSSSEGEQRRSDRRPTGQDYGYRGGSPGGFGFGGPTLYFGPSPFDVLYYRPYYRYGGGGDGRPPQMGLLEAVYSYVFGDGNPNANLDAACLKAAAQAIRASGGAVTAAQLLPFVPVPPLDADSLYVDEQFVLPIVTRLQGVPTVTADGDIVYTFDDVVVTAQAAQANDNDDDADADAAAGFLQEVPESFSAAEGLNAVLAPALGLLNLVGALYLGTQLASLPEGVALPGAYGLIQGLYPLLLAYALAFNAAPAYRAFQLPSRNAQAEQRNAARQAAAAALAQPNASLTRQLMAARALGPGGFQRVGGAAGDVAYSTDDAKGSSDLASQKRTDALMDFDRRLGEQ